MTNPQAKPRDTWHAQKYPDVKTWTVAGANGSVASRIADEETAQLIASAPELAEKLAAAEAEVARIKTLNAGAVQLATLLEQERDGALAALEFAHTILTLAHPELAGVEMDTLTTRQYMLWSRSPHAALLAKARGGGGG